LKPLRATKAAHVHALAVAVLASMSVPAGPTRADDYVSVRGAYYREDSTRVIQPMVEVERDTPSGLDVGAHFLVDAITSASVSAGVVADKPFTEVRNEAGLSLRKRWANTQATVGYKYSAESDYWSHGIGLSASQRLWQDTGMVMLSLGRSFDSVLFRGRTPQCLAANSNTCPLDSWFAGASYTQVLSPVMIAQASYEVAYLEGFLANPYRSVPNLGYEVLPYNYEPNPSDPSARGDTSDQRRLRNALAGRFAYYLPDSGTGLQFQYRFYWDAFPGTTPPNYRGGDPWNIQAHTLEGRVYQQVGRDLELRLLFRYYTQSHASFWCDLMPGAGGGPNCSASGGYGPMTPYYTSDPKLGPMHSEYPEVKVFWDAESWRGVPFFGWFAAGTFEVSYGRYFQSTSFGNAHVLQAGYRMPY
jgi:Protein of unknown function (DUF3570)